jgi:hypothetical protein
LQARRLITLDDALTRSPDPEELRQMMINAGVIRGAPAGKK